MLGATNHQGAFPTISDQSLTIELSGVANGTSGITTTSTPIKDTAPALRLIGGVRVFLNDDVALFGEYKYVKADFEFESLELDYEADQVYGGIEFYFGPGVKKFAFGPPPPQWP